MKEGKNIPRGPRGIQIDPRKKFDAKTFKRLLKYMLKYKWQYFIVIVCIIITSLVQVASNLFLRTLIDDYITPIIGVSNPVFAPLFRFIMLMASVYFVGVVCAFAYNRIMVNVSQGILKTIRDEMFNHMQTLPISYFDKNYNGDIMSRYTNDTDSLRQMVGQSLPSLFSSAISLIFIFISMLTINAYLSFAVLLGVFLMVILTKNIMKKSGKYFLNQQESLGNLNGFIEEMISGQKVIKTFTHEEEAKKQFDKLNDKMFENGSKANSYANMIGPITNNVGHIIYVFIAFFGGLIAIKTGSFTIGSITSFLTLTHSFTKPIMQITNQLNSVIMAVAGASRVFSLMDEMSESNSGTIKLVNVKYDNGKLIKSKEFTGNWAWNDNGNLIELKGDVRLNNISFSYIPGKEVIHDISLYAKPGQKIAFVGSTGAGKTTITNLLNRFYDIDSGIITYDGIDITKIDKNDLRKSLGMVLQDTNLFTGSIIDNIRYGREDATDDECIEAAKLANAHNFIEKLPNGYKTIIKENGSSLSQGERQLLAIARCAVANPPVMILDEATSSIDTRTERIVQDGMDKLMEGRTVFVIAHRLSTIQNSKAIMVMEKGKIIERGEHDQLIELKGKYYQLYTGGLELE